MNHLLNIINFYKAVKDSKITDIIKNEKLSYKRINDLIFLTDYKEETKECSECFINIYSDKNTLIPLLLNGEYFWLKTKEKNILKDQFYLCNFIHKRNFLNENILSYLKDFSDIFKEYMAIYFNTPHNHIIGAKIESDLIRMDAVNIGFNTYEISWFTKVYLIRDLSIFEIEKTLNKLIEKINNKIIYIFYKQANFYYLYLITYQNIELKWYEVLGYFVYDYSQTITENIKCAKEKLK